MIQETNVSTISVIGTGNVGWHLATAFYRAGITIRHVVSRSEEHAKELAEQVGAAPVTDLSVIKDHPELCLVCVSDDAISSVAETFRDSGVGLVHTSGSTGISVLTEVCQQAGVLYPLQTFTKGKDMEYAQVPFLIEATDTTFLKKLKTLAELLSEKVFEIDSEARRKIHIAAIFACNFSNHLVSIAADLMNENDFDYELLVPLITETMEKLQKMNPVAAQTGPAVRNDRAIIDRHLESLNNRPRERELYKLLSENILRYRNKHNE